MTCHCRDFSSSHFVAVVHWLADYVEVFACCTDLSNVCACSNCCFVGLPWRAPAIFGASFSPWIWFLSSVGHHFICSIPLNSLIFMLNISFWMWNVQNVLGLPVLSSIHLFVPWALYFPPPARHWIIIRESIQSQLPLLFDAMRQYMTTHIHA
jgi:hypothetical protein